MALDPILNNRVNYTQSSFPNVPPVTDPYIAQNAAFEAANKPPVAPTSGYADVLKRYAPKQGFLQQAKDLYSGKTPISVGGMGNAAKTVLGGVGNIAKGYVKPGFVASLYGQIPDSATESTSHIEQRLGMKPEELGGSLASRYATGYLELLPELEINL